jgi:hypothetical protein
MDVNHGREPILNQTERDHLELAATDVSPAVARLFSLAFAAILFAIPVAQASVEIGRRECPQALEVFQPFVQGVRQLASGNPRGLWSSWRAGLQPERLHGYEDSVESESIFASYFQPRTQQILTGWFGAGNDKVVLGRGGWIFYLPGVDYVVGPSIADRATFERAAQRLVNKGATGTPQIDPRPAILDFARQCREAGIHLVVVPVPDKAMMQPAQLYARAAEGQAIPVPNNAGYRQFVEALRAEGVDWFDPTPATVSAGEIRYLEQDTHWTPAYMDAVARQVAEHVRQSGVLPEREPLPLRLVSQEISRVGDLVDMLSLTKAQGIYRPQTVTIEQVIDERSGQPIARDAAADVLLLGDSFTNIFSAQAMGWGTGAGFGQHLAYHLRRPLDVIAFNGGASTQARAELARSENAARLGHKKVIVYQFAMRSLLTETWEPSAMVAPQPPDPPVIEPPPPTSAAVASAPPGGANPSAPAPSTSRASKPVSEPLVVIGRILQTSRVPAPGSAPYRDCLTFIKVQVEKVESGAYRADEMLVVFLAMKDNQWLPAATYNVGDRLRMQVIPFSSADPDIRSLRRADDTEDYTLRPFFVVKESLQ